MKKCKFCGNEGEFMRFCDKCGKEYIQTSEDLIKELMQRIEKLENKNYDRRKKPLTGLFFTIKPQWYEEAKKYYLSGYSIKQAMLKATGLKWVGEKQYAIFRKFASQDNLTLVIRKTKLGKNKSSYKSPEFTDYLRKRGQWVTARAKQLAYDNKFSYAQGLMMAQQEFNASHKYKNKIEHTQASIGLLPDENMNRVLLNILENVSKNSAEMTFAMEGQALNINNQEEWTNLISNILKHSKELSQKFGVENKFKTIIKDKHLSLSYGDQK